MNTTDSSYEVIARKWRPQRFAEVVGQEHVKRALQNAIAGDRVGHAYLFVGPRGIGKTTIARIFAKALNCEAGIVTEPCCECASCQAITQGNSLDLIEIDAASNRGVDSIRNLRETVQYTPARSRYKVYIIDEVHMLTKEAWNALLKTLEEPPPHVKFLFATTEPHKVLPTILSRCQRFDLRRLSVPLIVSHLAHIAQAENIFVEPGALTTIARVADGAMRDAESILDQMISFCGASSEKTTIREQDIVEIFGLASIRELHAMVEGILANDPVRGLRMVQEMADRGRDLEHVLSDAVRFVRNLLVRKLCPNNPELLDLTENERKELDTLVADTPPEMLQRILDGFLDAQQPMSYAINKRVYLEAVITRITKAVHGVRIEDVIASLAGLRNSGIAPAPPAVRRPPPVASGGGNRPAASPGSAPGRTPAGDTPAQASPTPAQPEPPTVAEHPEPAAKPAPDAAPPAQTPPAAPASPPETPRKPTATVSPAKPRSAPTTKQLAETAPGSDADASTPRETAVAESAPQYPEPEASPAAPHPTPETAGSERRSPEPPPDQGKATTPEPEAAPPVAGAAGAEPSDRLPAAAPEPEIPEPPPADTAEASAAAETTEGTETDAAELWRRLIQEVSRVPGRKLLKHAMQTLRPVSFINGVLEIGIDGDVPPEMIEELHKPGADEVIQRCFSRVSPVRGGRVLIRRYIPGLSDDQRILRSSPEVRKKIEQNSFVQMVSQIFHNAPIIDARG